MLPNLAWGRVAPQTPRLGGRAAVPPDPPRQGGFAGEALCPSLCWSFKAGPGLFAAQVWAYFSAIQLTLIPASFLKPLILRVRRLVD